MAQVIPIILAVASTAASIYSAVSSSQQAEKSERRNERVLAAQAEQTRKAAEMRALDEEKRHRRVLAGQRAKFGVSGVTMEGSPLLVQMESLKESEEQLRRIREGGELESSGLLEESKWRGYLAGREKQAGYVGAGQSLLSGVSTVYQAGRKYEWW